LGLETPVPKRKNGRRGKKGRIKIQSERICVENRSSSAKVDLRNSSEKVGGARNPGPLKPVEKKRKT